MGFIRYIFFILVFTGSTSIGFLLSKRYGDRVKELKILSRSINILQNKIKFTHKPLAAIFKEISQISQESRTSQKLQASQTLRMSQNQKENKISEIFLKASKKLQNQNLENAWSEAISEEYFSLNLTSEDIELVKSLGNVLGKTDIDGQMSEIEQFKILLENQIKNAEEEKNKNSKMYKSLGTIIGLAIVIILF